MHRQISIDVTVCLPADVVITTYNLLKNDNYGAHQRPIRVDALQKLLELTPSPREFEWSRKVRADGKQKHTLAHARTLPHDIHTTCVDALSPPSNFYISVVR